VVQAGRAHDALEEITGVIDNISQMSSQIATAAEEQSAVAEDINRNIVDISRVAEMTSQDSVKSYEASEAMSREIDNLGGLLSVFKTSDSHATHLQQAMIAHLSWKTKLRGFLDGKGSLDERIAFDHKACGFGTWYESMGRKELSHIQEIAQIDKPHRELHELIKRIVDLKKQGDREAAEREYQRVAPLSEEIVAIMQAIKNQL
jgi:methyl-accepting chemotaxis protein